MPAAGGLPAETLTYGYDSAFSLPSTLSSNLGSYVTNSTYTPYGEPWQVTTSTDATGATKWVKRTYEYHVGNRRLGRFALRVFASILAAALLLGLLALASRSAALTVLTHRWTLAVLQVVLLGVAVLWAVLLVDAWRLGRPDHWDELPWNR